MVLVDDFSVLIVLTLIAQRYNIIAVAQYLSGFGNEFESEALPGALPIGQVRCRSASLYLHT